MAQRLFNPNVQYFDNSGAVLAGGKMYFYETLTSTPLDTYSDETLTTPNTNPVVLDSAGRAGTIFLKNQAYKVVLDTSADVEVWSEDPVTSTDKAGKQTAFIPAGAMRPTVSNGCAEFAVVETTAGRPDMQVLDFDKDSDEHAQFQIAMPKSWDESTITVRVHWTFASGTGGVTWAAQGVAVSNDDPIDVAYGTAVTVSDTAITAEDLHTTAETTAITVGGTPQENDMTFFRIFRDVSDASDTLTADARLIGATLVYNTDSGNDD